MVDNNTNKSSKFRPVEGGWKSFLKTFLILFFLFIIIFAFWFYLEGYWDKIISTTLGLLGYSLISSLLLTFIIHKSFKKILKFFLIAFIPLIVIILLLEGGIGIISKGLSGEELGYVIYGSIFILIIGLILIGFGALIRPIFHLINK